MLLIDRIIGDRNDPDLHHKLHEYEHQGMTLDFVRVAPTDLDRRRLRARTDHGEDLAIALSRQDRLFDGAILYLNSDKAIVVRAEEQRWLRIVPQTLRDALELGYLVGNLHWRVRFESEHILVSLDGPLDTYMARLDAIVREGRATAQEIQ
ncbi:urease accessory protein UreE [Hyphomicrobium sp. 2TAF46]|uniref:urease accessory protein UreE n=1 Tax=Hyphomicrobium sp. 2TAF46 TaxID=3233019 RepID=UPI003F924DDD